MLTDIQTLALRSCLRLGTPAALESYGWEASPVPGTERQYCQVVINSLLGFEFLFCHWLVTVGKFHYPSEPPFIHLHHSSPLESRGRTQIVHLETHKEIRKMILKSDTCLKGFKTEEVLSKEVPFWLTTGWEWATCVPIRRKDLPGRGSAITKNKRQTWVWNVCSWTFVKGSTRKGQTG